MLVAEDDENLGEVLARGLREQGYVVDLVMDGEAAASYLRLYEYEVAVVDWRMPRLSGIDLIQRLRGANGAAQPLHQVKAGQLGHPPVEDRHLVLVQPQVGSCRLAVGHQVDDIALLAEPAGEHLTQALVVFGNKHPHSIISRGPTPRGPPA